MSDENFRDSEVDSTGLFPIPGNIGNMSMNVHIQTEESEFKIKGNKKRKTKKKKKETPGGETSGISGLFRYATAGDITLMVIGFLASLVNGAALPFLAVLFGQMTNMFNNVATHGFKDEANSTVGRDVFSDISIHQTPWTTGNGTDGTITRDEFTAAMAHFSMYYIYVACAVLVAVFIQTLCWESACERQIFRLRQIFFSQILRQDISWYDENEDGDLPHKLSDDLERIREGIGSKFSMLTQYSSTFITGIAVGFHANTKLTSAMIVIAPLVIGMSAVVARAMSGSAAREQIRYGVAGGIAAEVINAVKTVASFGGEPREIKRYGEALEEGRRITMGKYYVLSVAAAMMFVVSYGAFAFAFWYGSQLLSRGDATAGSVFTVFFSVMTGAFTVGNALPFVNTVSTAIGAASTIFGIIDRTPPIDSYSAEGMIPDKVQGEITFKDVQFVYPTRPEVKVLRGLTITIQPGTSVALVGASGAGKSTVVGLLLRFYDPNGGEVLLDGTNVQDFNLAWLRSQIGLVSQEPVLFGVSIADNIRYGRDNITEYDIVRAATLANAHSFIKDLPNGYDTQVGDKGTMMSGGQKQRIAIARALVRDPKILLLDEATSALDAHSEGVVQAALDNAMRGRTTVIIAHRLSTIRNVDKIYALKDGQVFESGSHQELMEKEGLYYSLVMAQKKRDHRSQIAENEGPAEMEVTVEQQPIPIERKKSGFFSRVSLRRSRSSATSLKNIFIGSSNDDESKEELAKRVSFYRIFMMNIAEWPFMLLTVIGCIIVGTSMPLFSSFYADVFHTFTLTGQDFASAVIFWTGVYVCFALIAGFGNFLAAICSSILTEKMIAVMRLKAFTSIVRQTIGWFDAESHTAGRLVTSLARDPPLIKAAAGFRAGQVLIAATSLVAALIIAFSTGWKLACILLVVVPIIAGAAYKQASLLRRHQKRDAKFMDDAGQVATEGVLNLKTVQALGKEKLFISRYKKCLDLPYKESKKQAYVYAIVFAISQSMIYVMYATAFRFGAKLISEGQMDPTQVYRVFFALSFSATAIGQAATYFQDFAKAKLSIGFVYRLMNLESEVDPLDSSGIKPAIQGRVTFKDIYFSYPTRRNIPILRGLNLTIEPGQTVALVGGSGCGKSTLIGLLERFYLPSSGKVLLDDIDITTINLKWLRSHVGLVTQEPVLFDCSIKDNIAYGAPEPHLVKHNDILEAAKTANIHEFIINLPQGYDTPVGDRGAKLSGGQKQRLAIARALIRNPKILLLDEATSALDTESEKIVQEALDRARKGRTSIVIAHRLSTIQNADVIAVIHKGKVAEKGTHEELKKLGGLYFELIKYQ
ncbi:ATP-dependent translocase ABCB1 [Halyomorpha halys]|uniref:ATP-dependent translocase ABCB1 n=1 Tax=Halyomorpha halys TaxID=286706 RepID=UPI0006D4E467|nr:multidrug resistance protein 2 [Halyomorpha halys]